MKALTVIGLALVLTAGSSIAQAGGRHDNDRHKRGWHADHKASHQYERHRRKRHHMSHYRREHRQWRHHRSHWRHHNHRGWRRHRDYYPAIWGAALVGSVVGHHLYHTHSGKVCYESHDSDYRDRGRSRDTGYSEVVGCHRIERLPSGVERRVEVPLSECR